MLATLAFGSSGCAARHPRVFVPNQPTAKLQYAYANGYRTNKNIVLRDRTDSGRWRQTRNALEMAYAKVIELFPEDLEYTPLAKLEIAEIRGGLDFSAAPQTRKKELREAIGLLQALQREYPQISYIHAKSMLDEALVWKKLREFGKVQEILIDLMDQYGASTEPEIQPILQTAQANYQQVYVE